MTQFGYAPTQGIIRNPSAHPLTAPAYAVPATTQPNAGRGTLVEYHGSSAKDHGAWITSGLCPCRCGGLWLRRLEADGWHQLVHVSAASVTVRAGR